jgi:hypothetical protein
MSFCVKSVKLNNKSNLSNGLRSYLRRIALVSHLTLHRFLPSRTVVNNVPLVIFVQRMDFLEVNVHSLWTCSKLSRKWWGTFPVVEQIRSNYSGACAFFILMGSDFLREEIWFREVRLYRCVH